MPLILEITSRALRDQMGEMSVRRFGREGGTIGRAEDNDWRLPDTERYISSHHATIDFQAGSYYLIDTSTNGVFVNGSDIPIGRSKPQRLFNGDILRMGEYLIGVTIDEGFELLAEDEDHRSSLAREDLVEIEDDSDDLALVDADEITGARKLRSELFGDTVTDSFVQRQKAKDKEKSKPKPPAKVTRMPPSGGSLPPARATGPVQPAAQKPADAGQAAPRPKTATPLPKNAVEAFLQGLGISTEELGKVDSRRLLHNAGLALREFALGTRELLQNRSAVKNSFRLEQTTIQAESNNPLKFSASADDTIRALLTGSRGEYGSAMDSVREAMRDLKHHEIALICAMRDSVRRFADYFDPDEMEKKFENASRHGALFGGSGKSLYWELYREVYETLDRNDKDKLPQQFAEDFARAYEEHQERLRRDDDRRRESQAGR